MKIIKKTSEQARREKAKRDEDRKCPSCGKLAMFGSVTTDLGGLFTRVQKKNHYRCWHCDCEWETEWR